MKRKKRIKMTAYHEIGHYILLKEYGELVNKIVLCPKRYGRRGGYNACFLRKIKDDDPTRDVIKMLEKYICIFMAGHMATKICFGFSSENEDDLDHWYIERYVESLRIEYLSLGVSKSKEDILSELENRTKEVIENNRTLLDVLANELLKSRFLTRKMIESLEEKYALS